MRTSHRPETSTRPAPLGRRGVLRARDKAREATGKGPSKGATLHNQATTKGGAGIEKGNRTKTNVGNLYQARHRTSKKNKEAEDSHGKNSNMNETMNKAKAISAKLLELNFGQKQWYFGQIQFFFVANTVVFWANTVVF